MDIRELEAADGCCKLLVKSIVRELLFANNLRGEQEETVMSKIRRKGMLEIHRRSHGILWWLIIGWWERPIASMLWYILGNILRFRGIKIIKHKK